MNRSLVHRFRELSPEERWLLVRASTAVVVAKLSLWTCSLQTARRAVTLFTFGTRKHGVAKVAWAVKVAARYMPCATCLTQALALHALLVRSGYTARIEIGVSTGLRFEAHAWVVCGDTVVLGMEESGRFERVLAWE